jgi:ABC-type branched-subunit amino acid transport system permease subunit
MNGMLSNIGKWVFGLLAVITVGLAIYFYLGLTDAVRTNLFLNWGYILIILGIVIALISVVFTAAVKGVNGKTMLIAVIAFAIIAVVAYIMSKGSFGHTYEAGGVVYSGKTHGWVDLGLNFFYVTLGVALLSILFSVVYKAVKK